MKRMMLSLSILIIAMLFSVVDVCAGSFVVKKGDNFWKLAKQHDVSWYALMALNSGKLVRAGNFDLIYPGQVFDLPIKIENVDVLTKSSCPEPKAVEITSIEPSKVPATVNIESEKPVFVEKSEFPAEVFSVNKDKLVLIVTVDAKDDALFLGNTKLTALVKKESMQQLNTATEQVALNPLPGEKNSSADCDDFLSATFFARNFRVPIIGTESLSCEELSALYEFLTRKKGADESAEKQSTEPIQVPILLEPEVSQQLDVPINQSTFDPALIELAQAEAPLPIEQVSGSLAQTEIPSTEASQATSAVVAPETAQAIANEQPLSVENSLQSPEEENIIEKCDNPISVMIISEYPLSKIIKANNLTCEDVRMLEKFLMKGDKLVILNE